MRGGLPALLTKRARRDLNPRPSEPESDALSTELRALAFFNYSTPVGKME